MSDSCSHLEDLLRRIESGDESAIDEIIRHYYEDVRRAVRLRLKQYPLLRRLNDSIDFVQDAAKSVFARMRDGRTFESPEDFIEFFRAVAANKVKKGAERHLDAAKRDLCRQQPLGEEARDLADPAPGPETSVMDRELVERVLQRATPEERMILRMRFQDRLSFREISEIVGCDERAVSRKLTQLVLRATEGV